MTGQHCRARPSICITPTFQKKKRNKKINQINKKSVSYQIDDSGHKGPFCVTQPKWAPKYLIICLKPDRSHFVKTVHFHASTQGLIGNITWCQKIRFSMWEWKNMQRTTIPNRLNIQKCFDLMCQVHSNEETGTFMIAEWLNERLFTTSLSIWQEQNICTHYTYCDCDCRLSNQPSKQNLPRYPLGIVRSALDIYYQKSRSLWKFTRCKGGSMKNHMTTCKVVDH